MDWGWKWQLRNNLYLVRICVNISQCMNLVYTVFYVLLHEKQTQKRIFPKTKVRVVIHPDSETVYILTCVWLYYNVENVTSSVVRLVPHSCPTETSSVYGYTVTTALTGILQCNKQCILTDISLFRGASSIRYVKPLKWITDHWSTEIYVH